MRKLRLETRNFDPDAIAGEPSVRHVVIFSGERRKSRVVRKSRHSVAVLTTTRLRAEDVQEHLGKGDGTPPGGQKHLGVLPEQLLTPGKDTMEGLERKARNAKSATPCWGQAALS